MSTYSAPGGPPPKPASQRRRRNKPASYGAAEAVLAGQADGQPRLGFTAHKMVRDMWKALGTSVEGQFSSPADWERARLEMWFLNQILTGAIDLTASNWQRVQNGLDELLVSPAVKRRAGIELRQHAVDVDEAAAVSMVGRYQQRLQSLKSV